MKRLFLVSVEAEVVVYAENEEEAESVARAAKYDIEIDYFSRPVRALHEIDSEWRDGIPYGQETKSCEELWREWVENNPEHQRKELEAAGQKALFEVPS